MNTPVGGMTPIGQRQGLIQQHQRSRFGTLSPEAIKSRMQVTGGFGNLIGMMNNPYMPRQLGQAPTASSPMAQPTQQSPMQQALGAGPSVPNPVSQIVQQMTSPEPLNNAVNQGMQFIGNTIPTNANSLLSSSPAFRNTNPQMASDLNRQYFDRGMADIGREGLAFARQAAMEGPDMQLQQLATLRGLENQELGLGNQLASVQMNAALGQILPLLRLMGGLF